MTYICKFILLFLSLNIWNIISVGSIYPRFITRIKYNYVPLYKYQVIINYNYYLVAIFGNIFQSHQTLETFVHFDGVPMN